MKHPYLYKGDLAQYSRTSGLTATPIVMQNVQTRLFETSFEHNTIKAQRINRHYKVGQRQKNRRPKQQQKVEGRDGEVTKLP